MTESNDAGSLSTPTKVLLVLLVCLGVIGVLMSVYSGVLSVVTELGLAPINEAQAEIMAEVRAQRNPLALAVGALLTVVKLGFSAAMAWGAFRWLRGTADPILRPTLFFGMAYEILASLWALGFTLFQWDKLADQFGRTLAADPNVPPGMAETAGTLFATTMAFTMGGMFVWALVKAALYFAASRGLVSPSNR